MAAICNYMVRTFPQLVTTAAHYTLGGRVLRPRAHLLSQIDNIPEQALVKVSTREDTPIVADHHLRLIQYIEGISGSSPTT